MSSARVDASVKVDTGEVVDVQNLQLDLLELFEEYGAKGQVAVTFDSRKKQPQANPLEQYVKQAEDHPHGHEPHEDGEAVEAAQGQYL